jgi:hypothetical protein
LDNPRTPARAAEIAGKAPVRHMVSLFLDLANISSP